MQNSRIKFGQFTYIVKKYYVSGCKLKNPTIVLSSTKEILSHIKRQKRNITLEKVLLITALVTRLSHAVTK